MGKQLWKLAAAVQERCAERLRVALLQDNSRPYFSTSTHHVLKKWTMTPYPPYSAYIASSDHRLFYALEQHLQEKKNLKTTTISEKASTILDPQPLSF
ncbi:hypothetical protein KIN20_013324 [Parelaphostrongylus tenuis]|uniref:Uncharacterized protein n=1 Tax=Parelaphostrongylus tenuis TaxID=148309 RepID=A0AAD5QMI2_PARTN|nr:hypothetical protein KIN20_013324 [Parelaphostrongylus tenuis]